MKKAMICLVLLGGILLFTSCSRQNTVPDTTTAAQGQTTAEKTADEALTGEFSVSDIYGKTVSSELFSEAKITVLNIWGTFCSPCIYEMPYLGQLSEEYRERGLQIVGLVGDVTDYRGNPDELQLQTAQQIVQQTGAAYTHLVPSGSLLTYLNSIDAFPTTVFLDSQGRQIGDAVVGARDYEEWKEIFEQKLAEVK